jgi:thiamine-phosphate pyrophosphorylase
MRHELREALRLVDPASLLRSRDTDGDVGTAISTPQELRRTTTDDVAASNLKRLQESLRTLEEYTKLTVPQAAKKLEQIRYQAYTAEKALLVPSPTRARLAKAKLYVLVTESIGRGRPAEELAREAVAGGADIIQLREKDVADRELLERARRVREATREGGALFIVNDRVDIALLSHADGVHLGQGEIAVRDARSLLGSEKIIGVSAIDGESALRAERDGADYIGVGAVYATDTKPDAPRTGLELVRFVSERVHVPHFAIGGITAANLPGLLAAGGRAVAICSAVIAADDVAAAARAFREILNRSV